jgi:hypothetical protein
MPWRNFLTENNSTQSALAEQGMETENLYGKMDFQVISSLSFNLHKF